MLALSVGKVLAGNTRPSDVTRSGTSTNREAVITTCFSPNLSTKGLSANASISEIPSILWHTTTDKTIYIFTDKGYCHSLDMNEISEARYKDKGQPLKSLIKNFESDEHCVSVIELDENNNKEDYLLFVTQMGMIKISNISWLMNIRTLHLPDICF